MRLPVNHALPIAAALLLGGCATGAAKPPPALTGPAATGPAADYPVEIGEPFSIGDITYRPSDQLNYDAVGLAVADEAGGEGVTGSHKTLPLPSYAEVTSLASGRTILVRLERRGPMDNSTLIGLSPAALAQLGVSGRAPVRVRRVNPPEVERAALRMGNPAPSRMETPEPLLAVLRRKLAEQSPLGPPPSSPAQMLSPANAGPVAPEGDKPGAEAEPKPAPTQPIAAIDPDRQGAPQPAQPAATEAAKAPEAPTPAAKPAAPVPEGEGFVVQVGAFSNEAGARGLASRLGAEVSRPGKYWLVRLGPFASRGEAAPALEKARAAGYSDARIQRVN
ncbi:sporulation protein SsgA [Novosphingobium sp. PC22D]|uniref:SPOR domain-containing protein n=1 Tax=Novosphingobium sp. PC22D TaxID=1962403 RepID=UPI000BF1EDC5|nr:SPOR domain-containing protein [Novosphingobium sp. PC22D]PEQ11279.1 sporulation protein SsgA [Novosphingobium sp. PC22D]